MPRGTWWGRIKLDARLQPGFSYTGTRRNGLVTRRADSLVDAFLLDDVGAGVRSALE